MPAAYRKHPLSFAISLSLAASLATTAMAASPTTAPADNPDTRIAATQGVTTPDAAPGPADDDAKKPKKNEAAGAKGDEQTLSVVEVVGVRASQERAIETKRQAQNIQDSITA